MTRPRVHAVTFTIQELEDIASALSFTRDKYPPGAPEFKLAIKRLCERVQKILPKLWKAEGK